MTMTCCDLGPLWGHKWQVLCLGISSVLPTLSVEGGNYSLIWQQKRRKSREATQCLEQTIAKGSLSTTAALEELTFDPSSAHPSLVVSAGGRRVECMEQKAPPAGEDTRQFDKAVAVVAQQLLSGGEHYWEVEVGDKPRWALGVMAAEAPRRGRLHATPSQGLWLLGLRDGKVLEAHVEAKEPRALRAPERLPTRVGIYLSFGDGVLAFYDASDTDALTLLFAFHERLPGPVYPFFDVCWHDKGKNAQPLQLACPEEGEA